jgi:hypothetical protein
MTIWAPKFTIRAPIFTIWDTIKRKIRKLIIFLFEMTITKCRKCFFIFWKRKIILCEIKINVTEIFY